MVTETEIVKRAIELGFGDAGFTTAEPFPSQLQALESRKEMYDWIGKMGLNLFDGTDPQALYPEARSIIVMIEPYFRKAFPLSMEALFGRCYLDDDRMTKDGLTLRIKAFRNYLRDNGIGSKIHPALPQRITAARSGLGTFGKNNLFYANRAALGGSWVSIIAIMIDQELSPGKPSVGFGCPDWCRNVCITACPTGALIGPGKIDPRRCISYLSYYGEGLTPLDLREPMGTWVYGCDRCQNVCPRNLPWLFIEKPVHEQVHKRKGDFALSGLLNMDPSYFCSRIWPYMFYIPEHDLWRWQMNAARAMGNSLDPSHVPDLIRSLTGNGDQRVRAMCAWALGHIGGADAHSALKSRLTGEVSAVREEIERALKTMRA